ncbi:MAG TPA: hypothetical protein VLX61_09500 [Anaerolineales bacterium]|nr:hypothetical protein [Anaerolineales bacterium]
MRTVAKLFLLATTLALALDGCGTNPSPAITATTIAPSTPSPTLTPILPTQTLTPRPTIPNGDRLVAVWNDGRAVDDDPGISSTITVPGFAGWKATGMDVLHGFEHGLTTNNANGDLTVRDFMLKDYPIIIRLSK